MWGVLRLLSIRVKKQKRRTFPLAHHRVGHVWSPSFSRDTAVGAASDAPCAWAFHNGIGEGALIRASATPATPVPGGSTSRTEGMEVWGLLWMHR